MLKDVKKTTDIIFGHCSNIKERLIHHILGKVRSTRSRLPLKIFYAEIFQTKSEAYKLELFFKSLKGRQRLKEKRII